MDENTELGAKTETVFESFLPETLNTNLYRKQNEDLRNRKRIDTLSK